MPRRIAPSAHPASDPTEALRHLDVGVPLLAEIAGRADTNGDKKLSFSEAKHVDSMVRGELSGKALVALYQWTKARTGKSEVPLTEIKRTLELSRASIKAADADGSGHVDGGEQAKMSATNRLVFGFSSTRPTKFDPSAAFLFDHDGDLPAAKRAPINASLPAAELATSILWRNNKAGNDNHWPVWSGRTTSRYVMDPTEAHRAAPT